MRTSEEAWRSFVQAGFPAANADEPLFIAEVGSNHDGRPDEAHRYVDALADAGVKAVKFQNFAADELVNRHMRPEVHERLSRLALPDGVLGELVQHGHERGVDVFTTPFSPARLEEARTAGVPAWKLASGDLTHAGLIRAVAATGQPIILSTGLAHLHEIERALAWIHSVGEPPVAVLHCTASYPCPDEEVNLDALVDLHQSLGDQTPLGLSDHSLGNEAVLGAVTLGARLVEKHVSFDRSNPGPDHGFAIQVDEIPELLASMSRIAAMRGDGIKRPAPGEERGPRWRMRRGLYAARDIIEGSPLTPEDIAVQRPDAYIGAEFAPELEGRRVTRGIRAGEPLRWDWLERG